MANYTSSYTGADLDSSIKLSKGSVADEFDSSTTYAVGALVIYNGDLYRCKVAGSGSWSAAKWDQVKISGSFAKYDGLNASGTWGISISGTAAKATNDKNGADITSTYYKSSNPSNYQTLTQVNNIVAAAIGDAIAGSY